MTPIDKRDAALLRERFPEDKAYNEALARVEGGEPLAYVLGEWYFYGLTFKLSDACLIPRPDTEHVVERAINGIKKGGKFIDLCTGSGCIAISVLKNRPDLTAYALDISDGALEKARENAVLNGVSDRITFIKRDIFDFEPSELPAFSAVISNPPYIRSDVVPTLEVAKSEPWAALDGGEDGMDFYRFIIKKYRDKLTRDGEFIFEIGYDQGEAIRLLCEQNELSCEITKDYGGNDRVARIIKL